MNNEYHNIGHDDYAHHHALLDDMDLYDPKPHPGITIVPMERNTGEIFVLKSLPIERPVIHKAISLLENFQTQHGPRRPDWDDSEDEQQTWDEIAEVISALKKSL